MLKQIAPIHKGFLSVTAYSTIILHFNPGSPPYQLSSLQTKTYILQHATILTALLAIDLPMKSE